MPSARRDDLVLILVTFSSKQDDELAVRDISVQSATQEVPTPGKEKVINGEYKISAHIVDCQVNKTEIETYKY